MKRILKSIIAVSLLAGLAVGMSGCNPDISTSLKL